MEKVTIAHNYMRLAQLQDVAADYSSHLTASEIARLQAAIAADSDNAS